MRDVGLTKGKYFRGTFVLTFLCVVPRLRYM